MALLKLASFLFLMVQMSKCDNYEIGGTHWFSTNDPDSDINQGIFELENLFCRQDAINLAKKYADDCIFVNDELGVMSGPDEVQNGYEQMFQNGVAGIQVDVLKQGKLGTFRYAMAKWYYFDSEGDYIKDSLVWVVLKQVEDGYKTYLKMEVTNEEARNGIEIKRAKKKTSKRGKRNLKLIRKTAAWSEVGEMEAETRKRVMRGGEDEGDMVSVEPWSAWEPVL